MNVIIYQELLQAAVPENTKVLAGVDHSPHVWLYYIDHKGWTYSQERLSAEWISNRIKEGAEYLYTDVPQVDLSPDIKALLDAPVEVGGSIRVYKLTQGQNSGNHK